MTWWLQLLCLFPDGKKTPQCLGPYVFVTPFSEPLFGGMDGKSPKLLGLGELLLLLTFWDTYKTCLGRGMDGKIKAGISKIESRCSFGVWNLKNWHFLVVSCGPWSPPPAVWECIMARTRKSQHTVHGQTSEISWNLRVAHPFPKMPPFPTKSGLITGKPQRIMVVKNRKLGS